MWLTALLIIYWLGCIGFTAWVADWHKRNTGVWALYAAIFGIIPLLALIAVGPSKEEE